MSLSWKEDQFRAIFTDLTLVSTRNFFFRKEILKKMNKASILSTMTIPAHSVVLLTKVQTVNLTTMQVLLDRMDYPM